MMDHKVTDSDTNEMKAAFEELKKNYLTSETLTYEW